MVVQSIKAVRETSQQATANSYLSKGWVLLGTSHGKDETGYPITTYTLGWPLETPPVE